jgi:large subunit ribosomal protein L3
MFGLLAKKTGMTQVFDESGNLTPVTIIKVEPNTVVAKKDGAEGAQPVVTLGLDDLKKTRTTKPYGGEFAEGIAPKRHVKEFRDFSKDAEVGEQVGLEIFDGVRYVDVSGVSKGKGFQGVVKRWGFDGGRYTHGSKFHREPGSTGQSTYPHKTFKNVKLPGRMGRENVTVLNLRVVKVDKENQIILVKGAVPGVNKGLLVIRPAVKKQRV